MERELRNRLSESKRIVVKYGTRALSNDLGRLNKKRFSEIAKDISSLMTNGKQVVLVTSGAIGAGLEELGAEKRPTELLELQSAAAIGQAKLIDLYSKCFKAHGVVVAQILLTREDFQNKNRISNFCSTVNSLFEKGVLPIINENDAITSDEIQFGDNDLLSSLVGTELDADALVLASTVNGFYTDLEKGIRVSHLSEVNEEYLLKANGKGGEMSSGGMSSKLKSAQAFTEKGGLALILDGRSENVLQDAFSEKDIGTIIGK